MKKICGYFVLIITYLNACIRGFLMRLLCKKCGKKIKVKFSVQIKGGEYISIGDNVTIGKNARLEAWDQYNQEHFTPSITLCNGVNMGNNCHIGAINSIFIGENVLMGSNIYITDHQHGKIQKAELQIKPSERIPYSKGPVLIEKNVWIGDGVVIMPNTHIGEGCVIGANAVVTKSFPPYSVIAGVPAVSIKCLE